jgi:hypothetical protein
MKKKTAVTKGKATTSELAILAAQDWMPLADLHDGCLIRKDGGVVAGLAMSPMSLELKSDREKSQIINTLHAALNGMMVPWEILSIYRPVALDAYLSQLDDLMQTADPKRRIVLKDYLHWVHGLVRSGVAVERRYYILMTRFGVDALKEHRSTLPALSQDFERVRGFRATVMDDALWRELLFLTFHADQAATESIPHGVRLPPAFYGQAE